MVTHRKLGRMICARQYDERGYALPLRVSSAVKAHQMAPTKAELPPGIDPPPETKPKRNRSK
jgi:hypothetical protein